MMRKILPVIFIALFTCTENETSGQVKPVFHDYIIKKLSDYRRAVPWEDIYIHTDRKEYISGEELWFSAYVTDRSNGIPYQGTEIVYVEVLNPSNQPVVQKRIKIENGAGPGCITIPDSLTTGKYILRAYTGLMKNFLPYNCFIQELTIYNALRDKVLKERPLPDNYLSVNSPGRTTSEPPLIVKVNNSKKDSVIINIEAAGSFRAVNKNLCYLVTLTRGVINIFETVTLSGNSTEIIILRKDISPGINQISVFDASGKIAGERYIYSPIAENQKVTVLAPQNTAVREKVRLEIDIPEISGTGENPASLSISVIPQTSLSGEPGIRDFMIFGTEFGMLPEKIMTSRLSDLPPSYIDSCLMNMKSNWINWDRILSPAEPLQFRKEKDVYFISGKLLNSDTDKPDTAVFVILSSPGKIAGFQYAKTDKNGRFTFTLPRGESVRDLIMQPLASNRNSRIQIESAFPEIYPETGKLYKSDLSVPPYIKKWSSNYQVGRIYGLTDFSFPATTVEILPERARFYGEPDIELIMDDYIKLPVMSEVFFELLPGVFLKNRRSVWEITIADPVSNRIYDEPPVLLIDGVVIDNASVIAGLDPEVVEKIDVIKERYLVGDFLFFGLVNVITRAGDLSNASAPEYALRFQYRVTEPVNTFIAPDYSTPEVKQKRIPDFRNTMYWNPSLIPGNDGKITVEFWSSDYAGDYVIDIQGITKKGDKISLIKSFTVR